MNIPCYNVSPRSPPWSLWKGNLFSNSQISSHQTGAPCTTIFMTRRCQSCSTVVRKRPLHKLGGGRWSVNLGHPAAEAALQLMRERDEGTVWSQLAGHVCYCNREGEKEENPHHRVKGGSSSGRRAACISARHAAFLSSLPWIGLTWSCEWPLCTCDRVQGCT